MSDPKPADKFVPPKELKAFQNDRQLCVARFSPCGQFLAAGAMESTVRRWVTLESVVSETGVLELWCVARDGRRWKLEFNVRERVQ